MCVCVRARPLRSDERKKSAGETEEEEEDQRERERERDNAGTNEGNSSGARCCRLEANRRRNRGGS